MHYYKTLNSDGTINSLQSCSEDISAFDTALIPISQAEFKELSVEMDRKVAEEEGIMNEAIAAEKDRIVNLEKENAALLFQLLTGEEYYDV